MNIHTIEFNDSKGGEYRLELSTNIEAILSKRLPINGRAMYRAGPSDEWSEASFSSEFDAENQCILISFEGKKIGKIDLKSIDQDAVGEELALFMETEESLLNPDANLADKVQSAFEAILDGDGEGFRNLEELLDLPIPLDPLSCLIKAGIISCAGQFVNCMPLVKQEPPGKRVTGMLRCFGYNIHFLTGKVIYRTVKCSVGLG